MGENACACGAKGFEGFEEVDRVLEKYQGVNGALIPVLQASQNVYGYLPREVINRISERMNIPSSRIYGVATFYSQFHLLPRGKNIIRVCQGTACHVRGAKGILDTIEDKISVSAGETTPDLKFTLETVACIGACGLAPVLTINEETYGRLTPKDTAELLDKY